MTKSKRYRAALKKVELKKTYTVEEAVSLVKEMATAKFNEAVDIAVRLGDDVESVNTSAHALLNQPGGAWRLFWHTVGRRAFDDGARLEQHLRRFGARRVVHGHTPHHGPRPQVTHDGRLWCFDGCFSRYWTEGGEGTGPIEATVALLPTLE